MSGGLVEIRRSVLQEIEDFCAETGMTASALGREAVGDNKLVARIHEGRGITMSTLERLGAFMSAHRGGQVQHAQGERDKVLA